jgi:HNH endonuclease
MRTCKVKNCGRKHIAKGYCVAHYQRIKINGKLNLSKPIGAKSGKHNGRWRGGKSKMPDGRVLIFCPDHPNPGVSGLYVFRYRLVMEKHLGRYLLPEEIVHHKNGDCTDDRVKNLEVMLQSDHARRHMASIRRNKKGRICGKN